MWLCHWRGRREPQQMDTAALAEFKPYLKPPDDSFRIARDGLSIHI